MKHTFTPLLLALALLSGYRAPARAQIPISGSSSGMGTLIFEPGSSVVRQEIASEGVDTHFGAFTGFATADRNMTGPVQAIANGLFTETFPNGTLFGTFTGTATFTSLDAGTFENTLIFTGGTGIFASATGSVLATGTFLRTGQTTFTTQSSYTGVLGLVPEPGSVLLLTSLSLSYGILFGLRRHARSNTLLR